MHTTAPMEAPLVPASVAARLMGCGVDTVYRNLEPAVTFPNGQKLYSEADARAWTRKRSRHAGQLGFETVPAARSRRQEPSIRVSLGDVVRIGGGTHKWRILEIDKLVHLQRIDRDDVRTSLAVEDVRAGLRKLVLA